RRVCVLARHPAAARTPSGAARRRSPDRRSSSSGALVATYREPPDTDGNECRDDRDERRGKLKERGQAEGIRLREDVERWKVRNERRRHDEREEPAQPT